MKLVNNAWYYAPPQTWTDERLLVDHKVDASMKVFIREEREARNQESFLLHLLYEKENHQKLILWTWTIGYLAFPLLASPFFKDVDAFLWL